MNELARRPAPSTPDSGPALLKQRLHIGMPSLAAKPFYSHWVGLRKWHFCCRNEAVVPWLLWLGWSSASHSGKLVCLNPSRTPWSFLLQLPSWTWSCTCLSCISCLTLLLLPIAFLAHSICSLPMHLLCLEMHLALAGHFLPLFPHHYALKSTHSKCRGTCPVF